MNINVWIFHFKQKTAYERRISDWSSDVCSSDLDRIAADIGLPRHSRAHALSLRSVKIGRVSCRERVCQYVSISVVAVSLKKKKHLKVSNIDPSNTHYPHN